MKNQYIGGNCLKRGTWTVCRFKGGGLGEEEEGWYLNAHCFPKVFTVNRIKTLIHLNLLKFQEIFGQNS